jgi:hypothetical protein
MKDLADKKLTNFECGEPEIESAPIGRYALNLKKPDFQGGFRLRYETTKNW